MAATKLRTAAEYRDEYELLSNVVKTGYSNIPDNLIGEEVTQDIVNNFIDDIFTEGTKRRTDLEKQHHAAAAGESYLKHLSDVTYQLAIVWNETFDNEKSETVPMYKRRKIPKTWIKNKKNMIGRAVFGVMVGWHHDGTDPDTPYRQHKKGFSLHDLSQKKEALWLEVGCLVVEFLMKTFRDDEGDSLDLAEVMKYNHLNELAHYKSKIESKGIWSNQRFAASGAPSIRVSNHIQGMPFPHCRFWCITTPGMLDLVEEVYEKQQHTKIWVHNKNVRTEIYIRNCSNVVTRSYFINVAKNALCKHTRDNWAAEAIFTDT